MPLTVARVSSGLIRLRILNALDIGSVANDHLGAKQWSVVH